MSSNSSEHTRFVTSVINAGGRATRLNDVFSQQQGKGIAKATRLDIGSWSGGEPLKIIDHQINQLLGQQAVDNIIVSAGDQYQVADYISSQYKGDDRVSIVAEEKSLGTAGDLISAVRLQPELFGDILLVNNVDTIARIDYPALIAFFKQKQQLATIAVSERRDTKNADAYLIGPYDTVLFSQEFDEHNPISREVALSSTEYAAASTGIAVFDTAFVESFDWTPDMGESSVYKELLAGALSSGALTAFNNGTNFLRDVATKETWNASRNDSELQNELWYRP